MAADGQCEDSLLLASRLLSKLEVDLNDEVSHEVPQSQAETAISEPEMMDLDELARARHGGFSASQPMPHTIDDNELELLEDEPSMSQFSQSCEIPVSLVDLVADPC